MSLFVQVCAEKASRCRGQDQTPGGLQWNRFCVPQQVRRRRTPRHLSTMPDGSFRYFIPSHGSRENAWTKPSEARCLNCSWYLASASSKVAKLLEVIGSSRGARLSCLRCRNTHAVPARNKHAYRLRHLPQRRVEPDSTHCLQNPPVNRFYTVSRTQSAEYSCRNGDIDRPADATECRSVPTLGASRSGKISK